MMSGLLIGQGPGSGGVLAAKFTFEFGHEVAGDVATLGLLAASR
jgi:hypothetical protein